MSSVYDTPEWAAWLASIREMPDDDNRRLIAADFLEENGEGERAEFIRWQCRHPHQSMRCDGDSSVGQPCPYPSDNLDNRERYFCPSCQFARDLMGVQEILFGESDGWVAERGFVSRVSGPLVLLIGGECGRCANRRRMAQQIERLEGEAAVVDATGLADDLMDLHDQCHDCHGTGRTPGVLRELVKREPVMKFEVTNKDPKFGNTPNFRWTDASDPNPMYSFRSHPQNQLPHELFRLVTGDMKVPNQSPYIKWFDSEASARAALSDAILRLVQPVEVPT